KTHRVASADGIFSLAFNHTDKDSPQQKEYDQRLIKVKISIPNPPTVSLGLVEKDFDKPIISIKINNDAIATNITSVYLNLTYSDSPSGINVSRYKNEGEAWVSWEGPQNTRSWTLPTGDGIKKVYYQVSDLAGNIGEVYDTIILDTVKPNGTIKINNDSAYTNNTNIVLNLTYSDELSGVDKVRYSNNSIDWTDWAEASETKDWELTIGDGNKTVYYQIIDIAGNIFETNDTIILDRTLPNGSIKINNDSAYTTTTDVILNLNYSDELSGVDKVRYSNNLLDWSAWEPANGTKNWELTIGDGIKTVYYQIIDSAGNSVVFSDSIILDTTLPTGSIFINENATYTNNTTVELSLEANDKNGIVEMRFSEDEINWSYWEPYNNSKKFNLSSYEGNRKIYVEYKDSAGLILKVNDSIILDLTKPEAFVLINNDAKYTNTTKVILNLFAKDLNNIAGMRFSNDGVNWSDWLNYTDMLFWELSSGYGNKILYAEFMDSAGNIVQVSDTIILDTKKPTGIIKINNDALYTNNINVKLTINASDENGIYGMRISNDGVNFSEWLDHIEEIEWNLSVGEGEKEVFVEFIDNAGNIIRVSDKITLDITKPIGNIIINNGERYTNKRNIIVEVNAYDNIGIAKLFLSDDLTVWAEVGIGRISWNLTLEEGEKKIYLRIIDFAGNDNETFGIIVLDMEKPKAKIEVLKENGKILIKFGGEDNISGIISYDVQYSKDGINWFDWLKDVNYTEAYWYNKTDGPIYFRARAKDYAGNYGDYTSKVKSELIKEMKIDYYWLIFLLFILIIFSSAFALGYRAYKRSMFERIEYKAVKKEWAEKILRRDETIIRKLKESGEALEKAEDELSEAKELINKGKYDRAIEKGLKIAGELKIIGKAVLVPYILATMENCALCNNSIQKNSLVFRCSSCFAKYHEACASKIRKCKCEAELVKTMKRVKKKKNS
ncbi:MAG: hypothetical protein AB1779_01505, partial [Candidatus Thermoplasmatota archaeon]